MKYLRQLGISLVFIGLAGCAQNQSLTKVQLESISPEAAQTLRETQTEAVQAEREALTREVIMVDAVSTGTDAMSEVVAQMAVQIDTGLAKNRVKKLPIAILPFKNLDAKTTPAGLGERLSENMIFQMQQHGYNLVDYRAVSLNTTLKNPLSRDNLSSIRNRFRIHYVLTGTYARHPDGLVINARVLDTTTRQIMATGQSHVSVARLEGEIPGYDPLASDAAGLIIENGQGRAQ
ncbi:FlgO family outer membrane protein [Aliamphritea ceti]|uniref:FlgO family outer membrane protein n=1 Tax=Aliamphritea ceti TaxID=1524258 RepID=UPI0021C3828F|nr:FlgO family outer membrane protein [Aliamphritea ceti]